MSEKEELLEEIAEVYSRSGELDFGILMVVFLAAGIALMLMVPKIYISSEIYAKSLAIERSKDNLWILKDENNRLRQDLERTQFYFDQPF